MKVILFLFALFLVLVSGESDLEQWLNFKSKHNKLYSSHVEDSTRFSIFQSNLRKIEEHNVRYDQGEVSYFLGVTPFADLTQEEFSAWLKRSYGNGTDFKPIGTFDEPEDAAVPDSFDWRQKNAVTEVKSQGQCGGCWSFAAVATTEGAYAIKYKKLVSFSEQQLIDCATTQYGMGGCNGGWENVGVQYIADHGVETEADYPFKGVNQNCQYQSNKVVTKVKGVIAVKQHNSAALKAAIAMRGPCTVVIMADYIYLYAGGIYEDNKCTNCDGCVNHAVTAVGYGAENNKPYWIIKNSWGKGFGENGYIRMKRAVNQCGVEFAPYYAVY